jgi:hypothetical protein
MYRERGGGHLHGVTIRSPKKTQSAKGKGIKITDAEGFKNFIETGEI